MESEIITYLKGGTPYIWLHTKEGIRVQKDITNELVKTNSSYKVYSWDCERGVLVYGEKTERVNPPSSETDGRDPYAALMIARSMPRKSVMFVHNIHAYVKDMIFMQMMLNSLNELKSQSRHIIFLSPVDEIPIEIRDYVTLLTYPLPDDERIQQIIEVQLAQIEEKYPDKAKKIRSDYDSKCEHIVAQAKGLTAYSVEQAVSQSLVINGRITAEKIFEEKRQMVKKSAALEFCSFSNTFKDVGGLDKLKQFIVLEIRNPTKFPRPKGALLLGIPGCGKSLIVKAAAQEAGLPVLSFDFAKVYRGIVGESESAMSDVVKTIDAVSPAIVIVDEIEKGLSGVASSAKTDGGVGDKVGSIWLKWMQDHTSPAIVFGTCNNISKLPAEYLRAGRWDAIYFVDLPNKAERDEILKIHCAKYNVNMNQEIPELKGYSGAEIEQMVINAVRFEIPLKDAIKFVVPLSRSMGEQIDELRTWAKERTLIASTPDEEQQDYAAYHNEGRAVDFLQEE